MKTTPSNYIDMEPQVSDYYGTIPGQERRAGICDALRYLDSHPEQVPGRTMTESEFDRVSDSFGSGGPRLDLRNALTRFGFSFMEDREPTNVEKLDIELDRYFGQTTDMKSTGPTLAEYLDRAGVKAPGGDDE